MGMPTRCNLLGFATEELGSGMAGVGASAEGLTPPVRGWQEPLGTSPTAPLPPGLSEHADPVLPGEQSSSQAPRASRWRNAPSLSTLEVMVLVPSLAAPGLPYLQSLQSLGALGTWRAAGGALEGKKKHRLRWERTQRLRRSRAGKDGLPRHAAKTGCAATQGTHRSQHGFG